MVATNVGPTNVAPNYAKLKVSAHTEGPTSAAVFNQQQVIREATAFMYKLFCKVNTFKKDFYIVCHAVATANVKLLIRLNNGWVVTLPLC